MHTNTKQSNKQKLNKNNLKTKVFFWFSCSILAAFPNSFSNKLFSKHASDHSYIAFDLYNIQQ